MKFYMLVLALDTTTRGGSVALVRSGALLDADAGDEARPHAERLPGDVMRLLARQGLRLCDVELFAVAAGPGSMTGLRIGIATLQGFALANGRRMVGVSTLDALRRTCVAPRVGAWLDAKRGEVFAALYQGHAVVDGPAAEPPLETLARWNRLSPDAGITFVGDGAREYAALITSVMPDAVLVPDVPILAPAIGLLAAEAVERGDAIPPGAVRALYVRRPDVELARERRAREAGAAARPPQPAPSTPTKP